MTPLRALTIVVVSFACSTAGWAGTVRVGSEFQVNTYSGGYQYLPSVGVAGDGDFVVAWQSHLQDGSGSGIFARRFASTGAALDATDFQVNTHTTSYQFDPSVSVAGNGDFVVTWTSSMGQDGDSDGIFARRFASSGVPLDVTDFQVNTHTTSGQSHSSVGVAGNGDFVVAWESFGQEGSSLGIFARRFASSGVPLDTTDFQVNT